MDRKKIVAIIVTYIPDATIALETVQGLLGQVGKVIIVDNTPGGSPVFKTRSLFESRNNLELISLGENVGIARAQNIGIRKALEYGTDFILLSDQDTQYPADYTAKMLAAYTASAQKSCVAAVVPDFFERHREERKGFVASAGPFSKKIHPTQGYWIIREAIASGMLIPAGIFAVVGFMDEELFIDWVDLEWCWRVRGKGCVIIGCADVVVGHFLGDETKKIGAKSYPVRSPLRHYYIVRNAIHLSLRSQVLSLGMRLGLLAKAFRYIVGFTLLGKPHWMHFIYSLRGAYDGLAHRLGQYRPS